MCVIVDKMYHLGVWVPLWSPNAAQPTINQTATITVTDGLCKRVTIAHLAPLHTVTIDKSCFNS